MESINDLKLAPFHIMATEGGLHTDQSHQWHMENIADICATNPQLLLATRYRWVDLQDETSVTAATSWWEALTGEGGEGMVVKPSDFTPLGTKGLLQPAVKCRGSEYLRTPQPRRRVCGAICRAWTTDWLGGVQWNLHWSASAF